MTEQQWLERTLSPTERCNPHAIRQQRAIYQGWISTKPREPGEQNDESTKEQKEQQRRWDEERARRNEKDNEDYWKKVW